MEGQESESHVDGGRKATVTSRSRLVCAAFRLNTRLIRHLLFFSLQLPPPLYSLFPPFQLGFCTRAEVLS